MSTRNTILACVCSGLLAVFLATIAPGTAHAAADWTFVAALPDLGTDVPQKISFPNDSIGWLLDSQRGIWRTRDSGKTWTKVTSPDPRIVDLELVSPSNGWARSFGGVYLTFDSGDHWSELPLPSELAGQTVGAVWFENTRGLWVAASVWETNTQTVRGIALPSATRGSQVLQAAIFFSSDLGKSWT